jgi:CheY-like chemotaxis protein
MPEMSGIEATQQIRKLLGVDRPHIVALTAHAFESDKQKCLESGMDNVLTKPINQTALRETLARWHPTSTP